MKKESPKRPIVVIHFHPLELYPPVCNLLNYLTKNPGSNIIVITTENDKGKKLAAYSNTSGKVLINRAPAISSKSRFRLFQYLFFYLNTLRLLIKHRPRSVLYFDTISSWPALIYKRMRGPSLQLLAHYHEYVSPNEYAGNMLLVKIMHRIEAKMYTHSYSWISQTNEVRLQKMIRDNSLENMGQSVFHTMPNYPSIDWIKNERSFFGTPKKNRLVYLGALGYDTMYLKEVTDWVIQYKDHFTLDFFAYNIDEKAKEFLDSIQQDCIRFRGGVNYEELPHLLTDYDIGLVIYKPVSDNWIYNAPNKVFEYLACGLDVWFAKTMTFTLTLAREDVYPKIIPVDFEKLDKFNFEKAVNREGLMLKTSQYFYEGVYEEVYQALN